MGIAVNQEFWIKYSRSLDCGPQNTDITACVYLDGRRDDTMAWAPFEPSPGDKKVHGEIRGSRLGGKVYYFVFSNPEIIGVSQKVWVTAFCS